MDRQELIEYLVDEEALTERKAVEMSNLELFQKALQWNGIIGFDRDIRDWAEPYLQEYYSQNPEELNLNVDWIEKKYHELVGAGIIKEHHCPMEDNCCGCEPESEPSPQYSNDIFLP